MRKGALATVVVAAVAGICQTAHASPLTAVLTSANGAGTYDATIACPAGDGPSWRYAYSGATTPVLGPLSGTWTGSVEVHDAGGAAAFVPAGDGRLSVTVDRGGAGSLEFGQGGCADAGLTLTTDANGHSVASGALPVKATGGSGTLRGFAGGGSVRFGLGLGPGADNLATITFSGDFSVRPPNLVLGTPTAYWRNLVDYLLRRLTVSIPVVNSGTTATAGDAYAVRLSSAALPGAGAVSGVPASLGRLDAGAANAATVTVANAAPHHTYALTARIEATDALDGALAPVTQTRTVTAPLLP